MRPMASTRAIEPPPAPISTISITGMRKGRPLPLRNRAARSTSKLREAWGLPILDQADLCRGAAHVEGEHLVRRRIRAAMKVARMAPPAGPHLHQADGKSPGRLERGEPAAGRHEVDRAAEAALC